MKIRGTATDKLADIIQALQLVRKTGLLTVERGDVSNASELGTIAFREGQVIDASVGRLRGADAFTKLITWTRCYFIFEPGPATAFPLRLPSPRSSAGNTRSLSERRYRQELPIDKAPTLVVPYRPQHLQGILPDFQRFGLSRIHRQLFLLIDGRRSIQELVRLLGRHPQEVMVMLADLESAGLIGQ